MISLKYAEDPSLIVDPVVDPEPNPDDDNVDDPTDPTDGDDTDPTDPTDPTEPIEDTGPVEEELNGFQTI